MVFSWILLLGAVAFAAGLTDSAAFGQAPPAADPAAAPKSPERDAFNEKLTAYKDRLKKLRSLKEEYQTANPARKDQILDDFNPLIKETESLHKDLIPLALKAYQASGTRDQELGAFLSGMLQWSTVVREDYETAYDVAKVLLNSELPAGAEILYAWAAFAAFNTMHLDDAEAWFKIADEKQVVEKADPEEKMGIRRALEMGLPTYRDLWAREQELRTKDASKELPRVRLKTTKGDIVLELFQDEAPTAVGNFLTLVHDQFYTDVPFHRVLPYFMAQGGDPTGTGRGGPGYMIPCECQQNNARMHFRGSISMAHAGPNTGGSQFFLTFVPTFFLNKRHTVFGRVVEGMDVLSDLQRINPEDEVQPAPDKILEAVIERGAPYEFEKMP